MTIANLLVSLNDRVQENKGQSVLLTLVIAPLIYLFINELVRHNARISNLQGPSGLPLIGNIWDIHINAAEKYREWSRKYGKVYQIQLGNIPIVVVNSASAARTIFGANAQALSSRPEFYTFHKVGAQYHTL
jgi:3-hydroxyphenylacetate 6-hydroxylase